MGKVKHYESVIEPVEFILKNDIPFCQGNIIKYVCRYKKKNGLEDLLKARDYLDIIIRDCEETTYEPIG